MITGCTMASISGAAPVRDWNLESNASVWWRARDIALANGDPIPSWTSKNPPAAYTASEATNRPLLTVAGVNGKPGADFDGVNDKLYYGGALQTPAMGTGSYCVLSIAQVDIAPPADSIQSNAPIWFFEGGYAGQYVTLDGGIYTVRGHHFDGVTGHKQCSYAVGAALPAVCIIHTRYDVVAQELVIGINGVDGVPSTSVQHAAMGSGMLMAYNSNSGAYFDGRISEICFKRSFAMPTLFIVQSLAEYGL